MKLHSHLGAKTKKFSLEKNNSLARKADQFDFLQNCQRDNNNNNKSKFIIILSYSTHLIQFAFHNRHHTRFSQLTHSVGQRFFSQILQKGEGREISLAMVQKFSQVLRSGQGFIRI